jgi:hypothetical protein
VGRPESDALRAGGAVVFLSVDLERACSTSRRSSCLRSASVVVVVDACQMAGMSAAREQILVAFGRR